MQRTRSLAFCALFTALIAIGAFIKISIPLEPFPMNFTLQFFFVLLAALLLGPRRACLSVGVYLALGLVGVPIFAAGGGPGEAPPSAPPDPLPPPHDRRGRPTLKLRRLFRHVFL